MNAQKRRMRQLQHKRAVEQLIEDRRRQFEADRQRDIEAMREVGFSWKKALYFDPHFLFDSSSIDMISDRYVFLSVKAIDC